MAEKIAFDLDWKLEPVDAVAVRLSLALTKHIPGWPGATDEQLTEVAQDIIDSLSPDDGEECPVCGICP